MQSKRTGPYCVNNTSMSVLFLKQLKNAIWGMQITTWRFEESPRPEAAWKQADGGLLHVDTWGQTRPPLGVQDGGGCALDSWKIHEKWQKLSSYKDFSVTETIHCLTLGVMFSKCSYRKNLDQMFRFSHGALRECAVTLPAIFSPGC